ncbi:hypothetical protein DOTSEDRAFT_28589 [Dothistroma septosporum NZE10]|uniref:DUF6923 domain-containing protein n=1 Tax=Dothistroma septosporum (strain NZE10 / CBS 128990) TaxID=675120 RepID=M2XJ05_DOTSN|nr:hypothetical protein DOTSEDRAFT_28589 [Dothistroma septosporum NZE10]
MDADLAAVVMLDDVQKILAPAKPMRVFGDLAKKISKCQRKTTPSGVVAQMNLDTTVKGIQFNAEDSPGGGVLPFITHTSHSRTSLLIPETPLLTSRCIADGLLNITEEAPANILSGFVFAATVAVGYNSLAYNAVDTYVYATVRGASTEAVVRMGWNGTVQYLVPLPTGRGFYVKLRLEWSIPDLYTHRDRRRQLELDADQHEPELSLSPANREYRRHRYTISTSSGNGLEDWAFVAGGGSTLYGHAVPARGSTTYVSRIDLVAKTWYNLGTVINVTNGKLNAVFAGSGSGDLFDSDGNTGHIWKVNVNALTSSLFTTSPKSTEADGARYFLNTAY